MSCEIPLTRSEINTSRTPNVGRFFIWCESYWSQTFLQQNMAMSVTTAAMLNSAVILNCYGSIYVKPHDLQLKSLNFNHILRALFQTHLAGIKKQNYKNCVTVQIILENLTVHLHIWTRKIPGFNLPEGIYLQRGPLHSGWVSSAGFWGPASVASPAAAAGNS